MFKKLIEKQIISAVEEFKDIRFKSVEDAVEEYGMKEVFDCWMRAQFLTGYTASVLEALSCIGLVSEEVVHDEEAD